MLSFLQKIREQGKLCSHTKDLAQVYLDATDYISNKCYELGNLIGLVIATGIQVNDLHRRVLGRGEEGGRVERKH